jgi:hypothetical protein
LGLRHRSHQAVKAALEFSLGCPSWTSTASEDSDSELEDVEDEWDLVGGLVIDNVSYYSVSLQLCNFQFTNGHWIKELVQLVNLIVCRATSVVKQRS